VVYPYALQFLQLIHVFLVPPDLASIKESVDNMIHDTIHDELVSTTKERHYTKRVAEQVIAREQDTLEAKMEQKLGRKILKLKNELASLRMGRLNIVNNVVDKHSSRRRVRPEGEDGDMSDTSAEEHESSTHDTANLSRRVGNKNKTVAMAGAAAAAAATVVTSAATQGKDSSSVTHTGAEAVNISSSTPSVVAPSSW
jgi:hypothetical protein